MAGAAGVYARTMNRHVVSDPEVMSGEPCFASTRVPVRNLWDALAAGESLDEFLDGFPTVRREQALAVLEEARALSMAAG